MEFSMICPFLILQILFTFHKCFIYFWFAVNIVLFKYKEQSMIYSPSSLQWEVAMILFTFGLDFGRIEIGSRANNLNPYGPRTFILPLVLSLPSILASVFFLRLQSYVLQVDIAMNAIGLSFSSLESILISHIMIKQYNNRAV